MKYKAVLYDVDGVLNRQSEYFSRRYAADRGLDPETLEPFFKGDFRLASVGKADLKEQLEAYNHLWQWEGHVDELLRLWFESESNIDNKLLTEVKSERDAGMKVCIATVQERYRASYIRDRMFPGLFDDYFISCELGALKDDPAFFERIVDKLQATDESLQPQDIIYFDDSQEGLDTAGALGIHAYLYEDIAQVRSLIW